METKKLFTIPEEDEGDQLRKNPEEDLSTIPKDEGDQSRERLVVPTRSAFVRTQNMNEWLHFRIDKIAQDIDGEIEKFYQMGSPSTIFTWRIFILFVKIGN